MKVPWPAAIWASRKSSWKRPRSIFTKLSWTSRRKSRIFRTAPLITAGGIYTKEDVQKALAYGADAVQLGTRFVTTEECDVHPNFKQAYLNAKEEDIIVIKSPVGMPGRAIRTPFTDRMESGRIPPEKCNRCLVPCKAEEAPYCITQALINAAKGDIENGLVFCGGNAWRETKIGKVEDIFKELTS